jgi:hypothetical protein
MKRKVFYILFAGSCLLTVGCDDNRKGNDSNTGSENYYDRDDNTKTHSTSGSGYGSTDGTTSHMGTNPTNSTGSTGHSTDSRSTSSMSDSTKNSNTRTRSTGTHTTSGTGSTTSTTMK